MEKYRGLLSRDRPSGSVIGSLEGLRGLRGGGGGAVTVLSNHPLSSSSCSAASYCSAKMATGSKVYSSPHASRFKMFFTEQGLKMKCMKCPRVDRKTVSRFSINPMASCLSKEDDCCL